MRFLIHEIPYEQRISAGIFQFYNAGIKTGSTEEWRLTQATDDYRFLRIDRRGKDEFGENNYLYHITMTDAGETERVSFRFWRTGVRVAGNIILADDGLTSSSEINGKRYENTTENRLPVWLPSNLSLRLLAGKLTNNMTVAYLHPLPHGDGAEMPGTLSLLKMSVQQITNNEEKMTVRQHKIVVKPYLITANNQQFTTWLDNQGWPFKIDYGNGNTVEATRYINYQKT